MTSSSHQGTWSQPVLWEIQIQTFKQTLVQVQVTRIIFRNPDIQQCSSPRLRWCFDGLYNLDWNEHKVLQKAGPLTITTGFHQGSSTRKCSTLHQVTHTPFWLSSLFGSRTFWQCHESRQACSCKAWFRCKTRTYNQRKHKIRSRSWKRMSDLV